MDEIKDSLDRLSELSDGEIADLEGRILSSFDKVEKEEPTRETVDAMTGLADALDAVRGETVRRTDQQAELARLATEASTRVRGVTAEDAPVEGAETEASAVDPTKKDPEDPEEADPADTADDAVSDDDLTEEEKRKRAAGPVAAVPALAAENEELSAEIPVVVAEVAPATTELATETPGAAVVDSVVVEPVVTGTELAASESAADAVEGDRADETSLSAEEAPNPNADEDQPAEDEPTDSLSDDTTTQKSEGAVTASAPTSGQVVVTPPAGNRPVPREERSGVNLAITAGADIPGVGSGSHLSNMDDVANAFAKKLHTLRNVSGGMGEQHTVATLAFEYPEERQLGGDDSINLSRISAVNSPQVITAAAAICAPLETLYDMNICGVTDRPVRDSLARFNADRGGLRMYQAPTLGNCVGIWSSTGTWNADSSLTITMDAAASGKAPYAGFPVTPGATATAKGCCDAVCPPVKDVILDAIYACMRFSNFTNRFFPEVIKANTDLALINHARFGEQYLLHGIFEQSTAVTLDAAASVGLTRFIVKAIRQAAVGIRRRHRLAVNAPMRVILPLWMLDAMVADIALQMPGDGLESLGIAESKLRAIFSDANVNVTWALDEVDATGQPVAPPAQVAGPLVDFPDTVSFPVFPEGSFLFLDGGTLDLGVVRDTTTIAANEYATFVESFESVAFTGCESLWLTVSNLCVSGAAAALVDTQCV